MHRYFVKNYEFEYVICEMSAIFFKHQDVEIVRLIIVTPGIEYYQEICFKNELTVCVCKM